MCISLFEPVHVVWSVECKGLRGLLEDIVRGCVGVSPQSSVAYCFISLLTTMVLCVVEW